MKQLRMNMKKRLINLLKISLLIVKITTSIERVGKSRKDSIGEFASFQEVHPRIVVARLQHDKIIQFNTFNLFKSRFKNLDEFKKVFI